LLDKTDWLSRVYESVGFGTTTTLLIQVSLHLPLYPETPNVSTDSWQSINNVVALIGEAACVLFVDHTGRRPPLIIGNIVGGATFFVAASVTGLIPSDARLL
jgi:hypothetical protein